MYCIYCGAELSDTANFCVKCGKPTSIEASGKTNYFSKQKTINQLQALTKNSAARLAEEPGYYCINCGCYIDLTSEENKDREVCSACGVPIIGKYLRSHNLFGSIAKRMSGTSGHNNTLNPEKLIYNYYGSLYYQQNNYPFEEVAIDKEKTGKYLVEVGYQKARASFKSFRTYIFFNLLIPEENGSFQEIDALVIFGSMVYVIEAKNRSGVFNMNSLSEDYWDFEAYNGETAKVYNPLLQNNEHIAALQHYLSDKLDFEPFFFNFVSLAGNGTVNWNIPVDPLDELKLGCWRVTNNATMEKTFTDDFGVFIQNMMDPGYDDGFPDYDDKYAQMIIKALEPVIQEPVEERDRKIAEMEGSKEDKGQRTYTYYFGEISRSVPILFRTNGIHSQVIYSYTGRWSSAYNVVELSENGEPVLLDEKVSAEWSRIDSEEALRNAFLCVKNGPVNNQSNDQGAGYSETAGTEFVQPSEFEAMFFHGCNDLATLNTRYRNLCKTFHPDGASGDEETFKKMQDAYKSMKARLG